jgi:hypothetical protein
MIVKGEREGRAQKGVPHMKRILTAIGAFLALTAIFALPIFGSVESGQGYLALIVSGMAVGAILVIAGILFLGLTILDKIVSARKKTNSQ